MNGFLGNLFATTALCSVLGLIVLMAFPLYKKYGTWLRYAMLMMIAVRVVLCLPLPALPRVSRTETPAGKEVRESDGTDSTAENPRLMAVKISESINDNQFLPQSVQISDRGNLQSSGSENSKPAASGSDAAGFGDVSYNAADLINEIYKTPGNIFDLSAEKFILYVWLAGCLAFLFYYFSAYAYRARDMKRWSRSIPGGRAQEIFKNLAGSSGFYKNTRVMTCRKIDTPLAVGFFKPVILMPETEYSDKELTDILRHEFSHLRRMDRYAKLLLMFAKCVNWFNPVIWLIAKTAQDDMEILCDEEAVKQLERDERIAYNETLLKVAKHKAKLPGALTVGFAFRKDQLKNRMIHVMTAGAGEKVSRFWPFLWRWSSQV